MLRRLLLLVLVVGVLCVCASAAHGQTTWYVDPDALTGADDGTSWDDAFLSLEDALFTALSGDAVRVAGGTYMPGAGRNATFAPADGVALYGGYAGLGAPDPDARDLALHPTVLSGDLAGDDLPGFVNRADNAYHVVTLPVGALDPMRLDGLTISGGQADGAFMLGGGVWAEGCTLALVDCTLEDNHATLLGGGLFAQECDLTLRGCEITGNRVATPASFPGPLLVAGGGVFSLESDNLVVDCDVHDNVADKPNPDIAGDFGAAGMALELSRSVTVLRSRFVGNVATAFVTSGRAGGLGVLLHAPGVGVVKNCLFVDNVYDAQAVAAIDGGGGALFNADMGGSLRVTNCRFLGNAAPLALGGGAYAAGDTQLANCAFSGNQAGRGGGLYNTTMLAVVNSSFAGNVASDAGGGVCVTGMASVNNCVLWGNQDAGGADESAQVYAGGVPPAVSYCAVQGWTGTLPGVGSHGLDPLFVDADGLDDVYGTLDDDLDLQASSPCIDAASNAAVPLDAVDLDCDLLVTESLPLDGLLRVRFVDDPLSADIGAGVPPLVDMGAFEFGARLPTNQWLDMGLGLAGTSGLPVLTGRGCLCPASSFELELGNALPGTTAVLVLGFADISMAFKSGTMVPAPDILVFGLPTGPLGELTLSLPWADVAAPGVSLWWQEWINDPGGPQGWAATNGVRCTTPAGGV